MTWLTTLTDAQRHEVYAHAAAHGRTDYATYFDGQAARAREVARGQRVQAIERGPETYDLTLIYDTNERETIPAPLADTLILAAARGCLRDQE